MPERHLNRFAELFAEAEVVGDLAVELEVIKLACYSGCENCAARLVEDDRPFYGIKVYDLGGRPLTYRLERMHFNCWQQRWGTARRKAWRRADDGKRVREDRSRDSRVVEVDETVEGHVMLDDTGNLPQSGNQENDVAKYQVPTLL